MWNMGDGMGWWMVFGTLCELLVVVAVVILVAHFLKTPRAGRRGVPTTRLGWSEHEQLRPREPPPGAVRRFAAEAARRAGRRVHRSPGRLSRPVFAARRRRGIPHGSG